MSQFGFDSFFLAISCHNLIESVREAVPFGAYGRAAGGAPASVALRRRLPCLRNRTLQPSRQMAFDEWRGPRRRCQSPTAPDEEVFLNLCAQGATSTQIRASFRSPESSGSTRQRRVCTVCTTTRWLNSCGRLLSPFKRTPAHGSSCSLLIGR